MDINDNNGSIMLITDVNNDNNRSIIVTNNFKVDYVVVLNGYQWKRDVYREERTIMGQFTATKQCRLKNNLYNLEITNETFLYLFNPSIEKNQF